MTYSYDALQLYGPFVVRPPIPPSLADVDRTLCLQMPYLRFVKMLSEAAPQHSVVLAEVLLHGVPFLFPVPLRSRSPPSSIRSYCPFL